MTRTILAKNSIYRVNLTKLSRTAIVILNSAQGVGKADTVKDTARKMNGTTTRFWAVFRPRLVKVKTILHLWQM